MAAASHAAVLSDIHIGNGKPTCWYQPTVHDDYLTAALDWLVANRDTVREVILLGDVFDLWTYEPSVRPPTMPEILAANPKLLGHDGPFARLVKAFPGAVKLLLGNHDGTLNAFDVAQLNAAMGGNVAKGEAIHLVECPVLVLRAGGAEGTGVAFTHGHHWCMFNSPDEKSPWDTLPVGHIVSRAIAYRVTRDLAKAKRTHAAELVQSGNPHGAESVRAALSALLKPGFDRKKIVDRVLDYIAKWSGMPKTEPILLPDGKSNTTLTEARTVFGDLYTRWAGSKELRNRDVDRAAAADKEPGDLAWFAQRVGLQTASDLVVMGHTHVPVGGLTVSPVDYVNNGYACVAIPDRPTNQFTFSLVDVTAATATLMKVVPDGGQPVVMRTDAPRIGLMQRGTKDFSCYVRIRNRSGKPLTFVESPKQQGWWVVPPPQVIPSGARADIWLQDELGFKGSSGRFTYRDGDGAAPMVFSFACPTERRARNTVGSPVSEFATKTGENPWRVGTVDPSGNPLQFRCIVEVGDPVTRVASAACHKPPVSRPGPTPRQQLAADHADYLELTRQILDGCKIETARGAVLCHAWLVAADGETLLDPTTEPGARPGDVRLKNPPAHLAGPDVYEVYSATYGAFDYVLIMPNGATGGPPNFGGVAFSPRPGSPNLNLVSFNVLRLEDDYRNNCKNDHHAEMQIVRWIQAQDARWIQKLRRITLHMSSRRYVIPKGERRRALGYSPCSACCGDLASLLTSLNLPPRPDDPAHRVRGRIAWTDLYKGLSSCRQHETVKENVDLLTKRGWEIQAEVLPTGMKPTDANAPVAADPNWPPMDRSTR